MITEQGGIIMDLPLSSELVAATPAIELEALLNNTVGVTGTGLFAGYELEVLSG